jgi:hypothetical protein
MSRSFSLRPRREQPDENIDLAILPSQRTRTIVQTSSAGARARTNARGEPLPPIEESPERPQIDRNLRHSSVKYGQLGPDGDHCVMCGRSYCDTTEFGEYS